MLIDSIPRALVSSISDPIARFHSDSVARVAILFFPHRMSVLTLHSFGATASLSILEGRTRSGPRGVDTCRQHVNPIRATTYDWVHTFLQHGIFQTEVEALMMATAGFGVTRDKIKLFLGNECWCFPKGQATKAKQLHKIFDAGRVGQGDPNHVKCTCAEGLGVYGMLRLNGNPVWAPHRQVRTEHAVFRLGSAMANR